VETSATVKAAEPTVTSKSTPAASERLVVGGQQSSENKRGNEGGRGFGSHSAFSFAVGLRVEVENSCLGEKDLIAPALFPDSRKLVRLRTFNDG
jgi:hypothetical protein